MIMAMMRMKTMAVEQRLPECPVNSGTCRSQPAAQQASLRYSVDTAFGLQDGPGAKLILSRLGRSRSALLPVPDTRPANSPGPWPARLRPRAPPWESEASPSFLPHCCLRNKMAWLQVEVDIRSLPGCGEV